MVPCWTRSATNPTEKTSNMKEKEECCQLIYAFSRPLVEVVNKPPRLNQSQPRSTRSAGGSSLFKGEIASQRETFYRRLFLTRSVFPIRRSATLTSFGNNGKLYTLQANILFFIYFNFKTVLTFFIA